MSKKALDVDRSYDEKMMLTEYRQGVVTFPDRREDYQVHKNGPRLPAVNATVALDDYVVNPADAQDGFIINGKFLCYLPLTSIQLLINITGTLPLNEAQGVHSLTDVPVFAMGPCSEIFGGVYNNIDIFFKISECLGLSAKGL
jgi:hypothetical protein